MSTPSLLVIRLLTGVACLFLASTARSDVTAVAGGYEVTYDIHLGFLPTSGSDVVGTYIFEWNTTGDWNMEGGYTLAGQASTHLSHIIAFQPTSSLLIGYALGVSGIGDEKDHIFTIVNPGFAASAIGHKWSDIFPGIAGQPRDRPQRHGRSAHCRRERRHGRSRPADLICSGRGGPCRL